jgi:hypothetical protein
MKKIYIINFRNKIFNGAFLKLLFCSMLLSFAYNGLLAQQSNSITKPIIKDRDTNLYINARTSFGLIAGFTQASIYGNQIDSLSSNGKSSAIPGFHVGLTANSMLGKYFWLKHAIIFTQKGAGIFLHDSANGTYSTTLRTMYLDLFPVNPTFHYKGFQVYAGPYLGILLDANLRKKNANGSFENDRSIYGSGYNNQSGSRYLQKIDFGFNVGLEYEFKCGFNVGVRYTRGYAELIDWAQSITVRPLTDPTKINIYTQYINVSVGYSFMKGYHSNKKNKIKY